MSDEPRIPRRYVSIQNQRSGEWKRVTAEVWDSIPGRENQEIWLKAVRPVVQLSDENRNVYSLIGTVHAALSDVGLRRRAQKFVVRAYYAGSYDEALRMAEEFVEFVEPE